MPRVCLELERIAPADAVSSLLSGGLGIEVTGILRRVRGPDAL
jgi:hypothetical protein